MAYHPLYDGPGRPMNSGGQTYEALGILLPLLSFAFVALRTLSRWRAFNKLHSDDWAIIVAQILAFGFIPIAVVWPNQYALGWETDEIPEWQAEGGLKWFYAFEILWACISPAYKVAVLLLYRRIFGIYKKFNIAIAVAGAATVAAGTGTLFSAIFQCVPVNAFWDVNLRGSAACINGRAFCLGTGIVNLIIDTYILLIPIVMTWGMQLPKHRKIALTGLFLLGAFVIVAGILRVYFLSTASGHNFSGTLLAPIIWSVVEPCVGIISACLPTIPALIKKSSRSNSARSKYTPDQKKSGSGTPNGSSAKSPSKRTGGHSKQESEALGHALSGWKSGMYTEIGSSAKASTDRLTRTSSSDDAVDKNIPPPTPGPFDPYEVNVTTRFMVQSSTAVIPEDKKADGNERRETWQ